MKALINIDYTYDFIATDGALTCGEPGQAIEQEIVRLTREFADAGDYVVIAVDVHDKGDQYHPETKLFPPHNIRGTAGRALYGRLSTLYDEIKHFPNVHYLDKTRYSAFAGTDLDLKLRERGITELHLVGDCTDICVLHTAVDAYNRNYNIVIHEKAVASFDQAGHEWALGHFKNCMGAEVVLHQPSYRSQLYGWFFFMGTYDSLIGLIPTNVCFMDGGSPDSPWQSWALALK